MRKRNIDLKFVMSLIMAFILLQTCSKDNTSPVEPNLNPAVLTVSPASGTPGTLLNISGYTVDPADSVTEVYIGGELTVFSQDGAGMQTLIPLFLDSATHWPAPPSGLLDVEIRKDGYIVALAKGAVAVDSLQHADGATELIRQDFQTLTNSLRTIWSILPEAPGTDPRLSGYRDAVMAMLDSLVSGSDSSLASLLDGTSSWLNGQTPDVALLDAILASSGALEYFNEAAGSLGRLTDSLNLKRQNGELCRGSGWDMDLACQMQIYVVLDDFANYFVKPTTTTYANTVGLAAGLIAVTGAKIPAEAIISASLTVFEFVFGTLAPSLFPAEVSDFSLNLQSDSIDVKDYTTSTISISAVNHPASISATEVLEDLLTALGLAGKPGKVAKSFRELLVNEIKWTLGLYRKAIEKLNSNTGNSVFIDPEAVLPQISWGPVRIFNLDLVELHSLNKDVIAVDTFYHEWKGLKQGSGHIQVWARGPGERAKVLIDNALCLGCVYYGGAFGTGAPASEIKTVIVGKPASLNVTIEGLPPSTDANVVVSSTTYSSGRLTASATLDDLAPDDYLVNSHEVTDDSGVTYAPYPLDTAVTLHDGDTASVTVTYKPTSVGLLISVIGLTPDTKAWIDISGPNGFSAHIVGDTLLDSLEAGAYTIAASPVAGIFGETLYPAPETQTVDVKDGELTSATVTYTPPEPDQLSLSLYFGSSYLGSMGKLGLLQIWRDWLVGGLNDEGEVRTVVPADYPNYKWIDNCWPDSGLELAGRNFVASGETHGSHASGTVSFTQVSQSEVTIEFHLEGVGDLPSTSSWGSAWAGVGFSSYYQSEDLILQVDNPQQSQIQLEVTLDGDSHFDCWSAYEPCGGGFARLWLRTPYTCKGKGSPVKDTVIIIEKLLPTNGEIFHVSRTISLDTGAQEYIGVVPAFGAGGGGATDSTGAATDIESSSMNGTITFRLLPGH